MCQLCTFVSPLLGRVGRSTCVTLNSYIALSASFDLFHGVSFVISPVPGETQGLKDFDTTATEITNVVISNLGGTGTYEEVMSMAPGENMVCSDTAAACVKEVSAPFFTPTACVVFKPLFLFSA